MVIYMYNNVIENILKMIDMKNNFNVVKGNLDCIFLYFFFLLDGNCLFLFELGFVILLVEIEVFLYNDECYKRKGIGDF